MLASSSSLFAAMLSAGDGASDGPSAHTSARRSGFAEAHARLIKLEHDTGAWCAALKFMYTHTLDFGGDVDDNNDDDDDDDGTSERPARPARPPRPSSHAAAKKALACFQLADYLGAESLRRACVAWMREFVSPASCCALFAGGTDMGDMFLASAIVAIATECIGTCVSYQSPRSAFWSALARLTASHMRDLLRSPDLSVISESALLDTVIVWGEAKAGSTDESTPEDIVALAGLLDLQRIPNETLASMFLSPRAVLEPAKDLFAVALARNTTNAPKRAPRGRVVAGIVFARQKAPRAPFELLIGDPNGKVYAVSDSPTLPPRCALVACNKRLVALGGDIDPDGAPRGVPTVDILDLRSGVVQSGPNMRAALLCSSFVADSARIFCCGGTEPDGRTSQSIDFLDGLDGLGGSDGAPARWSHFATMSSRRTCCASVISRGKLFVLGGIHASTRVFIDTVEVFDLATHLPTREHRAALTKMPLPRFSHAAVSVGAHIYVLGGADYDDERTDTLVVYDTESDTWDAAPRMRYARSDFSAAAFGGYIYVCGGTAAEHPSERYCIETRSWALIALESPHTRPHLSVVLAL